MSASNPLTHRRHPPPDPEAVEDFLAVETLLAQLDEEKRAYLDDWKARSSEAKKNRARLLRALRGEPEPLPPRGVQLVMPGTGEVR